MEVALFVWIDMSWAHTEQIARSVHSKTSSLELIKKYRCKLFKRNVRSKGLFLNRSLNTESSAYRMLNMPDLQQLPTSSRGKCRATRVHHTYPALST